MPVFCSVAYNYFSSFSDQQVLKYLYYRDSAKLRALRAKNVFTYFACLRDHMPACLACLRAHVLTCLACLPVHVSMCLACLSAHVPTCLARLRANVPCALTCSRGNVLVLMPTIFNFAAIVAEVVHTVGKV